MKALLILLFVLCATACADGGKPGATVKFRDGPEFRFSGGGHAVTINGSTLAVTHKRHTILYENGALYVDGRLVDLPAQARVVAFDGADIYVDGRRRE